MVRKSLTIALTLGILLGFTPSAFADPHGKPGPYLTSPDCPFKEAHPWQDTPGEPGPLTYCPGSAGNLCGFLPIPALNKCGLQVHVNYFIKQHLGHETGSLNDRRPREMRSQGEKDGDSATQDNRNVTR